MSLYWIILNYFKNTIIAVMSIIFAHGNNEKTFEALLYSI